MNKFMVIFKGREYAIEAETHQDALNKAMELDPELKQVKMESKQGKKCVDSGVEILFVNPKTGDWIE